jgi:succinate dehydrogenase/fumarate reductase cytochrome b subunit
MIRETTKWTWHMISGLVVLVLLGLHMLIMHLDDILGWFNPDPGGAVAWENVIYRGEILLFPITYVALLVAALYHGLYGLRVILFELGPPPRRQRVITGLVWTVGIVLLAVGVVTVIFAPGLAGSA